MRVFCNQLFTDDSANRLLESELARRGHELVRPTGLTSSNLQAPAADPALLDCDIAFGQPDPALLLIPSRVRLVHLTSAGYERYDRNDLRDALGSRGVGLTTSSGVYQEPCAEHALAMMLALARRLPDALDAQRGDHAWRAVELRASSRLLSGQSVLMLSYGAIARRLIELLLPLKMRITAVRRRPAGNEPVSAIPEEKVDEHLPAADHVMNVLPGGAGTRDFMSARRLRLMKPGAIFYNIGRGTTVDQPALLQALASRHLAAAYLDVFDSEPLPAGHPLWTTPNCYITPHSAGGHDDEFRRIVSHFLDNLDRFQKNQPLLDRII